MNTNPWIGEHLEAEYGKCRTDYTREMAELAVKAEYTGAAGVPQTCGMCYRMMAWYRAMIAAYQCTGCGAVRVNTRDGVVWRHNRPSLAISDVPARISLIDRVKNLLSLS